MSEWDDYQSLHSKLAAPTSISTDEVRSIPRTFRRTMGKLSLCSALAARQAVEDAGLRPEEVSSPRTGCVIGSTTGSPNDIEDSIRTIVVGQGLEEMPGTQFFKCLSHTAVLNVAQMLGIRGTVLAPAAACASGLQALGLGRVLISAGIQDVVICGGADEVALSATGSFDVLAATSTHFNDRPKLASRPFHAERDGLVCGDGSGILVLEEYERAVRRNARVYGEVIGYATCGGGEGISQSGQHSIESCIGIALADARVGPEEIDYVSAHATATIQGDAAEAAALRTLFADRTPVSSLKGHLGHTLGASGAIEFIACLEMMHRDEIIPTLGLDRVAEDCAGLHHVTSVMSRRVDVFIKNSLAFGGINATLVCRGLR
jgi:3-oxoacyl-[acyl-carrier-protein] synthase II